MTHPHVPQELRVRAERIEPGDFLPPQRALHGTRYRDDGFLVGDEPRDVVSRLPVLPGRVLLYGPAGRLDSVVADADVVVVRRGRRVPHDEATGSV